MTPPIFLHANFVMVLLVTNQLAANHSASGNQLMEDVVSGKADALESIYQRYGSLLRTVIFGVIRDEQMSKTSFMTFYSRSGNKVTVLKEELKGRLS